MVKRQLYILHVNLFGQETWRLVSEDLEEILLEIKSLQYNNGEGSDYTGFRIEILA